MAKRRRINPNRFKQQDDKGLFSFDPIRRRLFKWGMIAGAAGGFFMLRPEIVWQIVGVFIVVLISNYHINRASRQIPRWQATIISFLGAMAAIMLVVFVGTVAITYLGRGSSG